MSSRESLQRLNDEQEIRDLALRYCTAVDRRDWDLLREVFAPDATVGLPQSVLLAGADEIMSRYRRGLSKYDATHHVVTNHEITVEGDTARHSCLLHAQHVRHDAPGGPHFIIGGRYEDQLVRTPEGWRFKHRELVTVWTDGNPGVLRAPGTDSEDAGRLTAADRARRDAAVEWRGRAGGPGTWDAIADDALRAVAAANQLRRPRDLDGGRPATVLSSTGQPVVSFASNDYLGLTQHPAVRAAARAALDAYGTGSGSARLIVGSRPVHSRLEERIATWRGTEAAVLFTTGYAANLGVLGTMGRWASVVCSDELNHASIVDGCRLARAPTRIYAHCDAAAVDRLLVHADGPGIVVSDSVFSMDGDLAPLAELSAVCAEHGALLILDDAHLVLDHPEPLHPGCRVLRVGTLSKAVGSLGGFVCGPKTFTDLLVNKARSYIFTTATAPAAAAAATAAIDVIDSEEGDELRARLRANIDRLRPGHPSPIIPVIVGAEDQAIAASEALATEGILVPAIRPPTVPAGTSRLRVTVSAAHTDDDLKRLTEALRGAGIDV